jgi:hypothetical protein
MVCGFVFAAVIDFDRKAFPVAVVGGVADADIAEARPASDFAAKNLRV